jgi:RNA polymerase sigma-70 factor (ECF subfamily)
MKSEPNEYNLALMARDGDMEALSSLIQRTRTRLFALAYAELRHYEDAQDVVATALVRICRHIHRLQEPDRIGPWMNSIVRNEARRMRNRRTEQLSESASKQTAHLDDTTVFLLRIDIERALARLPQQQADALRLFHLRSQPISDIAERFGCSEGTIKSWLHRGRQQLAAIMEDYRPMKPQIDALILHTDLDDTFVNRLQIGLETADFHPVLLPAAERTLLLEQWKAGQFTRLEGLLRKYPLLILDEYIGGRSTFEILIAIRAFLLDRTETLRICLLCSDPWGSTAFAAWTEGVHLLINKNDPTEWERLNRALPRLRHSATQVGRGFAATAKWASNKTLAKNVQQGKHEIEPDDLALILLKDEDQASYRSLHSLGVNIEAMRQELLRRLGSPTLTPLPLQDFLEAAQKAHKTARFNRVEELTYVEAWQSRARHLSTAHLLLGILRAGESVTSQLLAEQGISVEALRSAALPFSAEEDSASDSYYTKEEEKFAPLWEQAWTRASDYVR